MTRVTFQNPGGPGTAPITVEAAPGATLLEVAEDCGLIVDIGHQVLDAACATSSGARPGTPSGSGSRASTRRTAR